MKKKALALFLATMTAASLLAGCGGSSGSKDTTKEETTEKTTEAAKEETTEEAKEETTEAAAEETTEEAAEETTEEAAEETTEEAAEDTLEDGGEEAADTVEEAADDAVEAVGKAAGDAEEAAEEAADEAKDAVEEAADDAKDAAEEAVDEAADAVDEAADDAKDAAEDAVDEAAGAVEEAADAVEEAADDAKDAAEDAVDEAAGAAEEAADAVDEAADDAKDAADEAVDEAADAVEEAADDAKDAADEAADAVEEAADDAKDAADEAADAVEEAADDAKDAVEEATEEAVDEAADKAGAAAGEAADAAEEVEEAVEEAADEAEEAVEEVAEEAEGAVEEAADEAAEKAGAAAAGVTEADLPTAPEFEPNPDYDKWTVVEYTIEDIQADLVCTVSAKDDFSEFYLETNFYGDDQMTRTTYDGTEYTVEEDKTGFMGGDTPAILDIAQEQDLWVYFDSAAASDDAAEAEEAVEESAAEAEEAVEEAAEEADKAVEEAAEEAEEAVEEAADEAAEAEEAVEETADEAVKEAADEAVEEDADDAEEASDEAEEAVDEAEDAAAAAAAAAVSLFDSAIYPDGKDVTISPASYNEAAPDWTEYNDLIKQIKTETDTEARVALMHKAEDILMATGAVIPIYYYNDLYVQKTDVEGIYSNLFGFKFFQFATCPRDVLKVNLASEPAKIDPALNSSVDGACLCVNLFAGLYTYDADGNLQPDLADHDNPYEVSDDGLVYTFHLQKGLKWSDGSDLTAKDFEYAWKRCADPMTAADYAYMFDCFALNDDGSINVEATDDYTLVATLNAPCAYFLDLAAFPAYLPVPQSAVEAESDWETNPGAWCAEAGFITNGAYTVSEWKHEESMVLVKNDNYYRADEVSIGEIDFMLSADDTAIYAAYQSGDLDFADTVPTNEIESIKDNEDFHIVDNLGTYYAAFNVNSPIFEGKTVDQAIAMRKAFALLIDRDYIIENIGQCEQKIATSYIPEGMADGNGGVFKENTDSYTYPDEEAVGYYPEELTDESIDEARALLEYAGFEFTEDGVLSDETPINITYLTNESTGHVAIAEAMQQDFAELGINMSIEQREWNVFLDERKNGQFDFAREGWLADFNDPINMLEMWTTQSGNNDCQFGRDPAAAVEEEAE